MKIGEDRSRHASLEYSLLDWREILSSFFRITRSVPAPEAAAQTYINHQLSLLNFLEPFSSSLSHLTLYCYDDYLSSTAPAIIQSKTPHTNQTLEDTLKTSNNPDSKDGT